MRDQPDPCLFASIPLARGRSTPHVGGASTRRDSGFRRVAVDGGGLIGGLLMLSFSNGGLYDGSLREK